MKLKTRFPIRRALCAVLLALNLGAAAAAGDEQRWNLGDLYATPSKASAARWARTPPVCATHWS